VATVCGLASAAHLGIGRLIGVVVVSGMAVRSRVGLVGSLLLVVVGSLPLVVGLVGALPLVVGLVGSLPLVVGLVGALLLVVGLVGSLPAGSTGLCEARRVPARRVKLTEDCWEDAGRFKHRGGGGHPEPILGRWRRPP
jgi:hypothetical protein